MDTVTWVDIATVSIGVFMALVAVSSTLISLNVYASSNAPDVIVYPELNEESKGILNLVIRNIGKSPAKNITFQFDSAIPQRAFGLENPPMPEAMDDGPLINGIPYMAPGAYRSFMWGQYGGLAKWFEKNAINVKVNYERTNSILFKPRRLSNLCTLDIYSFSTTDISDNSHGKKIADEVVKLNRNIDRLIRQLNED